MLVMSVLAVESCVAPIEVPADPKTGPEIVSVAIHNTPVWTIPPIRDLYTGVVVTTGPGYWTQSGTVEITIRNCPFTPYTDEKGNNVTVYYSIFYKTEDRSEWMGMPLGVRGIVPIGVYQSDSDYTVIDFSYGGTPPTSAYRRNFMFYSGDVSFRIQTVENGYFSYSNTPVFEGTGSEWTEFTITIPAHDPHKDLSGTSEPYIQPMFLAPSTSDPYSLPTSDPHKPLQQNPWPTRLFIIFGAVCIITISIAIVTYHCGKRKTKSVPQTTPTMKST
jgi:hypothetical protein